MKRTILKQLIISALLDNNEIELSIKGDENILLMNLNFESEYPEILFVDVNLDCHTMFTIPKHDRLYMRANAVNFKRILDKYFDKIEYESRYN